MAQDAQLISQAGQVESLASDGLVSVSTGAGQPQKNMELAKFADSLGSSVPLQQTSDQVSITGLYARTSDGKMVELTKESVASVMGDLLGNPLKRESIVTKDNIDVALTPGFYTMVFEPISIGGGTANFYGVMNVYESDTYIVQVGYATTGVILRNYKKSSKVWSAWQRVDNFGYNSLAELSSGVAEQIGVKNGSFYVKKGAPVTLSLGSGILFLKSEGTQHSGCFDVQYWTADIKPIGGVFSSSYINVTKNSGSGDVTIGIRDDAAQNDYEMKYILIG